MKDVRTLTGPVDDQVIHLSVLLPIPANEACAWLTRSDLLATWLCAAADVEPVAGGRYELFWNPEDRENDSTIGCRVTALEPGQLLAVQWRSPRQFKELANAADPLTHVVFTFAPEHGGTRVHLVHSGWRSSPEWNDARRWQERAWKLAFQALEQATRRTKA